VSAERRRFGVADPKIAVQEDGATFLRGIIEGRHPEPPMAEVLSMRLVDVEPGVAVFEGLPSERYFNPMGTVHGGFMATLLDSVMGCGVMSTLPAGAAYTTLELKVNLLRVITATTGVLCAEGRVLHGGRTTAAAEGKVFDTSGRLVAFGTTTCALLIPRSSTSA
jgi:uncharacterized protein (TIGR00369 family)